MRTVDYHAYCVHKLVLYNNIGCSKVHKYHAYYTLIMQFDHMYSYISRTYIANIFK